MKVVSDTTDCAFSNNAEVPLAKQAEPSCQWKRVNLWVWGVAEAPRRGAGDRGAHHKGVCAPSSV
jgi:hypothetical protein